MMTVEKIEMQYQTAKEEIRKIIQEGKNGDFVLNEMMEDAVALRLVEVDGYDVKLFRNKDPEICANWVTVANQKPKKRGRLFCVIDSKIK